MQKTGRLGSVLSDGTIQQLVTLAPSEYATLTIFIFNRTDTQAQVNIALANSVTPNAEDWIKSEFLYPGDSMDITGLAIGNSAHYVLVQADVQGLSINAVGYQKDAN